MGAVMCDSRLQAILLLCAAVSVSAELLVEDPDGEDGKVDVQRGQMLTLFVTPMLMPMVKLMLILGQMEPVMVEVQRPSREEPRVEGRMVKTMTSPSQVIRVLWDGLKGRMTAPPRPQVVNGPTMDSWKLNFRLKRGDLQRVSFPASTFGSQYGYHLRKRGRNTDKKYDWIRLLKKQADEAAGMIQIPQVLRLGKKNLKGIIPLRTDPYWLSWWKTGSEDNLQQAQAMISDAETEAWKKDMQKVIFMTRHV